MSVVNTVILSPATYRFGTNKTKSTYYYFGLTQRTGIKENMYMMRNFIFTITAVLLCGRTVAFAPNPQCSKQSRYISQADMAKDENLSEEERSEAVENALKIMTNFSNKYVTNTGTKYCADKSVAAVVIKGLAEHKVTLGAPLCPCRYYDDKEKEAKDGYWNCPCVPMRERHECHCMLFLTEENDFAGDETNISVDEVKDLTNAGFLD